MRLVIIGAGGHGREVAEIARHDPTVDVLGFVDEDDAMWGQTRENVPILGGWPWFEGVDRHDIRVICAVGAPVVCRRLAARAKCLGLSFGCIISPRAHISPSALVGEGVTVFPNVVVTTGSILSDHCILNVAATVSHDCTIGACSFVAPGAHLAGNVTLGEACWIGIGASIIQGCSIGSEAIVGAGAAVIRDVPARATVVGVPARVLSSGGSDDETAGSLD